MTLKEDVKIFTPDKYGVASSIIVTAKLQDLTSESHAQKLCTRMLVIPHTQRISFCFRPNSNIPVHFFTGRISSRRFAQPESLEQYVHPKDGEDPGDSRRHVVGKFRECWPRDAMEC